MGNILDNVFPAEAAERSISDTNALYSAIATSLKSAKLVSAEDESPVERLARAVTPKAPKACSQ